MKSSKLLLAVFLLFASVELFAVVAAVQPAVGVPLDGGLLAILAGAGAAYFAARKRKRQKDNM